MRWRGCCFFCAWLLLAPAGLQAGEALQDYLYYRDVNIPPYQKLREFFDMPDRPGRYEVSVFSEGIGPLTFRVLRVRGEHEHLIVRRRSYRLGNHGFQAPFGNPAGDDDLIVEIANSNPLLTAKVSVYVVELK